MVNVTNYYDREKKLFCHETTDYNGNEIKTFESFESFVDFLNGDLSNVVLSGYDFKGVSLKKYNISNAVIDSKVLIEQGLYDNSFYQSNIQSQSDKTALIVSEKDSKLPTYLDSEISNIEGNEYDNSDNIIFYISDIHLDSKLLKKFPLSASENEIRYYIKSIVNEIKNDFNLKYGRNKFLCIVGDTSHVYEINKMFYEELTGVISHKKIIVVLGNHEIWDYDKTISNNQSKLESAVCRYELLFKQLQITFLNNMLFVYKNGKRLFVRDNELLSASIKEIRDFCLNSPLIILGGIGFSGYEKIHNYSTGIYRDTISSMAEDVVQTKLFESVYEKVKESVPDLHLIILTHMPKENWSNSDYNPNWIYVSGHTHRNGFITNDLVTSYFDNQIGYNNTSFHLKHIQVERSYDIFKDYKDGIYEITVDQYCEFCRGKQIKMTCNRSGVYQMVKKNGLYGFFITNDKGKLFILDGGIKRTVEKQDIQHYYDSLQKYSEIIKSFVDQYYNKMKKLSELIKSIGGSGKVHGCIIDIDYFNHIYVNPIDGKTTPYYAEDIVMKTVYDNIPSILASNCKQLYDNYNHLLSSGKLNDYPLVIEEISFLTYQYYETDIYRVSKIFKSIQYMTDNQVVRIWNEKLLFDCNETDRRELISSMLSLSENAGGTIQ